MGINRFADTAHNLQYCEKDIRDLSEKLKEKYGANIQVDLLFNEEVTMENVKSLKKKLLQSNEDDKVIIAYSGHGLLSKSYDYYLSTYKVNFNQPEQNGLPYDELENLVDGIKARKKLLMIDACHSGEVDKEDMQKIAAVQADLKKENNVSPDSRGIKLPPSQNNKLGTKNSFELMQELFVNVGRGTGTTIISAAAGTQFALERGDLKNGVFTYSVLELLKTGKTVTVNELKKHVSRRVSELTKGLQQPTTRNEIQSVDWVLW
ncbi:MAG: caspase family protein [Bacteroidota bacterium]